MKLRGYTYWEVWFGIIWSKIRNKIVIWGLQDPNILIIRLTGYFQITLILPSNSVKHLAAFLDCLSLIVIELLSFYFPVIWQSLQAIIFKLVDVELANLYFKLADIELTSIYFKLVYYFHCYEICFFMLLLSVYYFIVIKWHASIFIAYLNSCELTHLWCLVGLLFNYYDITCL